MPAGAYDAYRDPRKRTQSPLPEYHPEGWGSDDYIPDPDDTKARAAMDWTEESNDKQIAPIVHKPPPLPPVRPRQADDSELRYIDEFVSFDYQRGKALLFWKKERDRWECESIDATDDQRAFFPAPAIKAVQFERDTGRFLFMHESELSHRDFMFRLENKHINHVLIFRSIVDSRFDILNHVGLKVKEMDELVKKLRSLFEKHRASIPPPPSQSPSPPPPPPPMPLQPAPVALMSPPHVELQPPHPVDSEDEMSLDSPATEDHPTSIEDVDEDADEQMIIDSTATEESTIVPETQLEETNTPRHRSPTPISSHHTTQENSQSPPIFSTSPTHSQSVCSTQSEPHQSDEEATPRGNPSALPSAPSPSAHQESKEEEEMEPISEGDLVIRLRKTNKHDDDELRVDSFDVWDGPWRVEKFASETATALALKRNSSNRTRSSQPLNTTVSVKLLFPRGSKAHAFTDVKILRKAFELPLDMTDVDALKASQLGKLYKQAVEASKNPGRPSSANPLFIARLENGAFVTFSHVSAKGTDDDMYEISHLRAKRVMLRDRKKFAGERLEDAETQQWTKENPRLMKKNRVAVVEYLVHWAGWASEDDTWERAQDNISDEPIKVFEEVRTCPTIFPS